MAVKIMAGFSRAWLFGATVAVAMTWVPTPAHADALGQVWQNVGAATHATIGSEPATPPDAEFHTLAIDYNSSANGYDLLHYLNSPSFFNESANFSVNAAGYGPNASVDNSYFIFTGSTPLNAGANSFVMSHDDGLELSIPSLSFDFISANNACCSGTSSFVINAPGAGNYNFILSYGEAYGAPADLNFAINNQVVTGNAPEPGTLALMTSGLGLLLLGRHRRSAA